MKIIRYCEYHYQNKGTDNHEFIDDEDIDEWDLNLIMVILLIKIFIIFYLLFIHNNIILLNKNNLNK